MRHDLIGPRRLRPAGTFNPVFTMTEERSDRVLKGLVMAGVTEGAQNGVLPGARPARPPQPALIVKAIEGQQSVTAPISAHDPMYAAGRFTHQHGMHIDAAKHHIQADHFSRQKGGELRAQYHQKEFKRLQGQGANPTQAHYKQAVGELHDKFSQVMRSLESLGKAAEMQKEPSSVTPPPKVEAKPKVSRRARPTVELPRETMAQVVGQKLKSLEKAAQKLAGPIPQH